MKSVNRSLWTSAITGGIGGGLGAVCGSASLLVVFFVGAVAAVVVAWLLSGMIK